MNETEKTLPQLTQEQQSLEHKLSRASLVADNILTPGWIEKYNPKASRLRLGPDNDHLFENLERAVNIRYRLLAEPEKAVIPAYQSGLAQVTQEIEKKQETSPKIPSFTPQEAALLGALIANRNGALIKINGSHILTFEVDTEILQTCQKLQHTALNLQAIMQSGLPRDQYIESARNQVLDNFKKMLEAENIESVIDSQENPDVETILIWLYFQNDKMLGLLPDFLEARLDRVTRVARRGYMVEGIFSQWIPSGEVLSRAKRRLQESQAREVQPQPQLAQKTEIKKVPISNYILTDEEAFVILGLCLTDSIKRKFASSVTPALEGEFETALNIISSLTNINQTDYPFGSKSGYLQLRSRALSKLQGIIFADPTQQESLIDQHQNETVKRCLKALCQQNSSAESRKAHLYQTLQEIRRKSASQVKREEDSYYVKWLDAVDAGRKRLEEDTKQEQVQQEKQSVAVDDQETTEDVASTTFIFEQPPAKRKVPDIERRDPEVRQKIAVYLDQIAEKGILEPVTSARLNKEFQRLKKTFIENEMEKRYVRPAVDKHGYTVFTPAEIAKLLYISYHSKGGGLTPALVTELEEIIDQSIKTREKEQLYNNYNSNPQ